MSLLMPRLSDVLMDDDQQSNSSYHTAYDLKSPGSPQTFRTATSHALPHTATELATPSFLTRQLLALQPIDETAPLMLSRYFATSPERALKSHALHKSKTRTGSLSRPMARKATTRQGRATRDESPFNGSDLLFNCDQRDAAYAEQLRVAVDGLVQTLMSRGNIEKGCAIRELYNRSFEDEGSANLLDAVCRKCATAQQVLEFGEFVEHLNQTSFPHTSTPVVVVEQTTRAVETPSKVQGNEEQGLGLDQQHVPDHRFSMDVLEQKETAKEHHQDSISADGHDERLTPIVDNKNHNLTCNGTANGRQNSQLPSLERLSNDPTPPLKACSVVIDIPLLQDGVSEALNASEASPPTRRYSSPKVIINVPSKSVSSNDHCSLSRRTDEKGTYEIKDEHKMVDSSIDMKSDKEILDHNIDRCVSSNPYSKDTPPHLSIMKPSKSYLSPMMFTSVSQSPTKCKHSVPSDFKPPRIWLKRSFRITRGAHSKTKPSRRQRKTKKKVNFQHERKYVKLL